MSIRTDRPIVVGVDGSDEALEATRWAAVEAARCGAAVRLVEAVPWTAFRALGPAGMQVDDDREAAFRLAREHVERAAVEAVRTVPRDRVGYDLRDGRPAQVLAGESERASMLVVGDRGSGGFAGLLVGSVAVSVAAGAPCPVVVVRGETGPADGPIVLGVSGSPDGEVAIEFAFEQAYQRGVPLIAVRAWSDVVVGSAAAFVGRAEIERHESDVLRDALALWQRKYPLVTVEQQLVLDRPAAALVTASADAQLVVVGSRGHGERVGTLLGSVSRAVVHHAHCPVAVLSGRRTDEDR